MTKRIVVNVGVTETRLAVQDGNLLTELYVERARRRSIVGNIYKGVVTNVLPGMQAAFVDIGLSKDAFLYARRLHRQPQTGGDDEAAAARGEDDPPDVGRPRGRRTRRRRPRPAPPVHPRAHRGDATARARRSSCRSPRSRSAPRAPASRPSSPSPAATSSTCRRRGTSACRGGSTTKPSASGCAASSRPLRPRQRRASSCARSPRARARRRSPPTSSS